MGVTVTALYYLIKSSQQIYEAITFFTDSKIKSQRETTQGFYIVRLDPCAKHYTLNQYTVLFLLLRGDHSLEESIDVVILNYFCTYLKERHLDKEYFYNIF